MKETYLISLMQKTVILLKELLKLKTPMQKTFIQHCEEALGTDITPDDLVPDTVACAITVSTLINRVDATFPKVAGTWTLYDILAHRNDYELVEATHRKPGDIVISPTGLSKSKTMPNGHTGIIMSDLSIASNDSATGKFMKNYTLESWTDRYVTKGGYPLFVYRREGTIV